MAYAHKEEPHPLGRSVVRGGSWFLQFVGQGDTVMGETSFNARRTEHGWTGCKHGCFFSSHCICLSCVVCSTTASELHVVDDSFEVFFLIQTSMSKWTDFCSRKENSNFSCVCGAVTSKMLLLQCMFFLALSRADAACDAAAAQTAASCMSALSVPTSAAEGCNYVADYLACYPDDCCTSAVESALSAYESAPFSCSVQCGSGSWTGTESGSGTVPTCDAAAVQTAASCMAALSVPTSADGACDYVANYLACYPGGCCTAAVESALSAYESAPFSCSNVQCGTTTTTTGPAECVQSVPVPTSEAEVCGYFTGYSDCVGGLYGTSFHYLLAEFASHMHGCSRPSSYESWHTELTHGSGEFATGCWNFWGKFRSTSGSWPSWRRSRVQLSPHGNVQVHGRFHKGLSQWVCVWRF